MFTLNRLIQYVLILIMGIIALVSYKKKRAMIAARPYWISIATILICWAMNALWGGSVLWFAAIGIDNFGFFLMTLAPLTGKKKFAYAGAGWFVLSYAFFYLAMPSYIGIIDVIIALVFATSVFWVGKIGNKMPKYVFIAMAALAVILGGMYTYMWRNLAFVALCYYLAEQVAAAAVPKAIDVSQAPNMDDTLKALELLQELRDSGVITQEEFDAKKKQLLGL